MPKKAGGYERDYESVGEGILIASAGLPDCCSLPVTAISNYNDQRESKANLQSNNPRDFLCCSDTLREPSLTPLQSNQRLRNSSHTALAQSLQFLMQDTTITKTQTYSWRREYPLSLECMVDSTFMRKSSRNIGLFLSKRRTL